MNVAVTFYARPTGSQYFHFQSENKHKRFISLINCVVNFLVPDVWATLPELQANTVW